MSDPIFVMIFLPVESMYDHYFCAGIDIPTISLTTYVSLIFDSGLGLGSESVLAFIGFVVFGLSRRTEKEYERSS